MNSNPRFKLLAAVSLFGLAAAGAGRAQTVDSSVTGQLDVTSVNVTAEKPKKGTAPAEAPSQAPLSAIEPESVVSKDAISILVPAGSDFANAINFTPSVVINSPNGMGNGEATSLQLRGFSDGQFNITMDGIPFGDTNDFTHHTTAYFPSDTLSTIAVDRGPGYASTVGEATFGGTIAMHSLDVDNKLGGTVTGEYGSWNTFHVGAQLQTGVIDNIGTKIAFSAERNGSNGAITLDHTQDSNQTLKIVQPIGDSFHATLFSSLQYSKYNNANQITGFQEQLYGKNYGALSENPNSQQWVDANFTRKNTDFEYLTLAGSLGQIDIDNKAYTYAYSNHERDANNPNTTNDINDPNYDSSNAGTALGYYKQNRYRAIGDVFKLSHDFDNAGYASGTLQAGLWVEHQNNDRYVYYTDFDTGLPYTKKLKTGVKSPFKYDINSKINTLQPYVEYDWKPIDSLTITPGFKNVSFSRHQDGPIDQTSQQPVNSTASYSANLPYLSINYRVTPNASLYAQYAKGFLAPNVEVFYVNNPAADTAQPEKTTNYQVGGVWSSGRLSADADFYYINFNNYLTSITEQIDGSQESVYVNDGAVRYRGLEGEATYIAGYGVSLFASGSLNNAKASAAYNAQTGGAVGVPGAPDWTFNFGPKYDDGRFFASLLTKIVGPTPDATGTWWIKSYNSSNLVAGVHLGAIATRLKDIKLQVGIYNVFDHRSVLDETAAVSNGQLDFQTSTFDYQAPRSADVTLSASF